MSQLLRFKIVFVLALDFYVYIQLDDEESTKEAKQILFWYRESIMYYTQDSYIDKEKLFKINFFELFMVNNNSIEVKWLADFIYRKKLLDEIDLNNISDDFVSQNVRRYF